MSNDSRIPAGIPAGGQFAAQTRPEATVHLEPGDPVGYTYRAENMSSPDLMETLIRQQKLSPGARGMRVEDALDQMFAVDAVDREDGTRFHSDELPKSIFGNQLTCSDAGWAPNAPQHQLADGFCTVCGQESAEGCLGCGEPTGDGDAARVGLCADCYTATLVEMA